MDDRTPPAPAEPNAPTLADRYHTGSDYHLSRAPKASKAPREKGPRFAEQYDSGSEYHQALPHGSPETTEVVSAPAGGKAAGGGHRIRHDVEKAVRDTAEVAVVADE